MKANRHSSRPDGPADRTSQTLDIPEQDSPYVAVVDAYGRIVSTAPYSRRVRIGHLAKGLYEIRTLAKKGRSKHIGYFIK